MSAIQLRLLSLAQDGHADRLQALLDEHADDIDDLVNFVDTAGYSALMYAARGDYVDAIETLLNAGADVNLQSPLDGHTALHTAAFHGSLDALDLLLRAGADADVRDHAGVSVRELEEVDEDSNSDAQAVRAAVESALAARERPIDLTDQLTERNAQEEQEEGNNEAEHEEHAEINEADLALQEACSYGDIEGAQHALDAGANPDQPDAAGLTPLMLAAHAGHLPMVQFLIAEVAVDRDAQHARSHGDTALMLAVRHGHLACVSWMIGEGACGVFGLANEEGETADSMRPVERATPEEMEAVIEQALRQAGGEADGGEAEQNNEADRDAQMEADEREQQQYQQQQQQQQDEYEEEQKYSTHQQQEQPQRQSSVSSSAPRSSPSSVPHPSDERAFRELDIPSAMSLVVARYQQTCVDLLGAAAADPTDPSSASSPFIVSALENVAPSQGALMLSGRDCQSAGVRQTAPDPRLTDQSLAPLLEVLCFSFPQCPLRMLDLSSNHLTSHSLSVLSQFVTGSQTLTSLDVSRNDIDRLGGEALAHALARQAPPSLTRVNIGHNPLGDAAIQAWADMLTDNRTLVDLNLANTECSALPLMRVCTALTHNHTLRRLNLDSPLLTSLQEETTAHLARTVLALNTSLVSLSLQGHKMTDSGASWLAAHLLPHPTLTELDLRRNQLTARGVAEFVGPIANRPVECLILLDANLLRGQTAEEISDAIAQHRDTGRNSVGYTSRQGTQRLRAKAPL